MIILLIRFLENLDKVDLVIEVNKWIRMVYEIENKKMFGVLNMV